MNGRENKRTSVKLEGHVSCHVGQSGLAAEHQADLHLQMPVYVKI